MLDAEEVWLVDEPLADVPAAAVPEFDAPGAEPDVPEDGTDEEAVEVVVEEVGGGVVLVFGGLVVLGVVVGAVEVIGVVVGVVLVTVVAVLVVVVAVLVVVGGIGVLPAGVVADAVELARRVVSEMNSGALERVVSRLVLVEAELFSADES